MKNVKPETEKLKIRFVRVGKTRQFRHFTSRRPSVESDARRPTAPHSSESNLRNLKSDRLDGCEFPKTPPILDKIDSLPPKEKASSPKISLSAYQLMAWRFPDSSS